MRAVSNLALADAIEAGGAVPRPWTPDDFICFAIVVRDGLPQILAALRRPSDKAGAPLRSALAEEESEACELREEKPK